VESQQELRRNLSGIGQRETTKIPENPQQISNRKRDFYTEFLPEEPRNCKV
jgi:hypothetical protein